MELVPELELPEAFSDVRAGDTAGEIGDMSEVVVVVVTVVVLGEDEPPLEPLEPEEDVREDAGRQSVRTSQVEQLKLMA